MHYVVKINGKTHVVDSQSVMPVPDDVAYELQVMIFHKAPEELINQEILILMGA